MTLMFLAFSLIVLLICLTEHPKAIAARFLFPLVYTNFFIVKYLLFSSIVKSIFLIVSTSFLSSYDVKYTTFIKLGNNQMWYTETLSKINQIYNKIFLNLY